MDDISPTGAGDLRVTPQPIIESERIVTVDVLRGVAILGILVTNITAFSFPGEQFRMYAEVFWSSLDRFVFWSSMFFVEGKFYSLFSFLFGLGVAVQFERARSRNQTSVPLYVRRLLVLLIIGLLHDIFIWNGMILINYALLGFLILPFHARHTRTLLRWAVGLILLPVLTVTIYSSVAAPPEKPTVQTTDVESAEDDRELARRKNFDSQISLFSEGAYLEQVRFRFGELPTTAIAMLLLGPYVLAMFLVGMVAWRIGLFKSPEDHLGLLRGIWWWGLAIGLAGNGVVLIIRAVVDSQPHPLVLIIAVLSHQIGNPALCFAYISGIVLLIRLPHPRRVLLRLAPIGRTALSNYILQSLIGTTIFYSFGFGLFGRVGPAVCFLIVLAVWSLQIPLSSWWIGRNRFGPVEWLWRSLTYRRIQPMQRSTRTESAGSGNTTP